MKNNLQNFKTSPIDVQQHSHWHYTQPKVKDSNKVIWQWYYLPLFVAPAYLALNTKSVH